MFHVYGRRLRSGGNAQISSGSTYAFVALYNDSSIGHILRVMYWLASTTGTGSVIGYLLQGTVGTLLMPGLANFTGEQAGAGSIYSGQDAVAPLNGAYVSGNNAFTTAGNYSPWWYIRPGFSLVFKALVLNGPVWATFFWEDLEMSMLSEEELR
jgi:hypothetical protein